VPAVVVAEQIEGYRPIVELPKKKDSQADKEKKMRDAIELAHEKLKKHRQEMLKKRRQVPDNFDVEIKNAEAVVAEQQPKKRSKKP